MNTVRASKQEEKAMKNTKSEIRAYLMVIGLVWTTMGLTQPLSGTIAVGYNDGPGMLFTTALPFWPSLRLGVGYTAVNPGRAEKIHNLFMPAGPATGSRKSADVVDLRLDFTRQIHWFELAPLRLFAGPRLAFFNAQFDYPIEADAIDLHSTHWGVGIGLEAFFRLSRYTHLVVSHGFDYFFLDEVVAGDSVYRPDNTSLNARPGVEFTDINEVLHQPVFEIRWMVGVQYRFAW